MADSSKRIRTTGSSSKNRIAKAKPVTGELQTLQTAEDTHADLESATARLLLAKASKEEVLSQIALRELQLAEKHLLIREDVEKIVFETSRALRDKIFSLCVKLSPELANNSDPASIQKHLKKSFGDLLANFTNETNDGIESLKT